jgi:hypothetical protein
MIFAQHLRGLGEGEHAGSGLDEHSPGSQKAQETAQSIPICTGP